MSDSARNLPVVRERTGRPTKFRPEYTKQLIEFFDIEPYFKDVAEKTLEFYPSGKVRKATEKTRLLPSKMPTLYRFARSIGVDYTTIWLWAEKGEDPELEKKLQNHMDGKAKLDGEEVELLKGLKAFSKAYNEAKLLQKEYLIAIGLAGAAPPAAFIFVAKNVTDMKDERVNDVKVTDFTELIKAELATRRGNSKPDTIRS